MSLDLPDTHRLDLERTRIPLAFGEGVAFEKYHQTQHDSLD